LWGETKEMTKENISGENNKKISVKKMNQFESNEFKLPELGLEIIIWSEMVVFHLYIRKMVVVSRWLSEER